LGTTLTNQNCIHEDNERRFNSEKILLQLIPESLVFHIAIQISILKFRRFKYSYRFVVLNYTC